MAEMKDESEQEHEPISSLSRMAEDDDKARPGARTSAPGARRPSRPGAQRPRHNAGPMAEPVPRPRGNRPDLPGPRPVRR
jgi:hypothetical protein